MRRDEHALAGRDRRRDRLVPVGQEPRDRVLQRLGRRQVGRREPRVARIARRMPRVVVRERRRRDVVAAPPDLRLRLAVLRGGLRLVQALQRAVVALVQPPVACPSESRAGRVRRARSSTCGSRASGPTCRRCRRRSPPRAAAGRPRRASSRPLLAQIDVGPAGEPVFLVPDAFAVTEQDDAMYMRARESALSSASLRFDRAGCVPRSVGRRRRAPLRCAAAGCTSPCDPTGWPSRS